MFCGSVSVGYGSVEGVFSAYLPSMFFQCEGRIGAEVTRTSERWSTPAALPRHGLRANRSYSTSFIQPKLKGDYSMKKFLSIFIALAMVLSLFAGVGARSAKAATSTLSVTPSGNFVGGADAVGVVPVDAIGTVTVAGTTYATVNVTTAGIGNIDLTGGNVSVMQPITLTSNSKDADWKVLGVQYITFTGTMPLVDDEVTVTVVAGVYAVGTVLMVNGQVATIDVTTTAAQTITDGTVSVMRAGTAVNSIDPNWKVAGSHVITFDTGDALALGDVLDLYMVQDVPATKATAFLMVSGTAVTGDVATVTWQDTVAASHTATYTVLATDITTTLIAAHLASAINAVVGGNVLAVSSGAVITVTQNVKGTAGNGKTLTATTTAGVIPTLTIHTLGGLPMPAYVENGKTIQLVAVDATGAVVTATWACVGATAPAGPSAIISSTGLVTANLALTGVSLVTATSGTATGVFAVIVIPVQTVTSLKINLVPAVPVSITKQQFGAIASNAAYSALDYTTQVVWTDALPVASIAVNGLLTYSTDETGNVKIATGVVTLVTVVGPVTRVIVLTIGTDIVTVDGKATSVDTPPEIVNGRTFVPIRFIAETFGSTVTWLPETKGVTIVLGDMTIGLQIANATAVINGNIIALEAAPYIKNSRTMVPLRVISESFGGDVAWDPSLRTITITYVLPIVPIVPLVP